MNYNIQLLRAVAIFFVILDHVSSWFQFYNPDKKIYYSYQAIAKNGVPIFIMISGALLLYNKQESISDFFKKRVKRIAIPFVFWSYIYLIYQKNVPLLPWQRSFDAENISFNPFIILKQPTYGHLWFMYLLISLYLTVPILRKISDNISKNLLCYILVLLMINSTQQYITGVLGKNIIYAGFDFKILMNYTIYLLLGFVFIQPNNLKNVKNKTAIAWFLGGIIINITLPIIFANDKILAISFWSANSPFLMLSTIGIFILIINLRISPKLESIIKSLGDSAFGIFFIHFIVLYALTLINIGSNSLFTIGTPAFMILMTSCICFVISYVISIILKKIPIIRETI